MSLRQKLGKHACEDFEALASRKGVSVEQLEVEAKRWYLEQAQNKLQFSRTKPRLRRLDSK